MEQRKKNFSKSQKQKKNIRSAPVKAGVVASKPVMPSPASSTSARYQRRFPRENLQGTTKDFSSTSVKQVYVSSALRYFREKFRKTYNLKNYHNHYAPCFFLGIYNTNDISIIKNHRGYKIVCFGGSDILKFSQKQLDIRELTRCKNITFVAESNYIAKHLKKMKVPYTFIPISPAITNPNTFKAVEKGPNVCIYSGIVSPDFYNIKLCMQIISRIEGLNAIVVTNPQRYKYIQNNKRVKLDYPRNKVKSYNTLGELIKNCYSKSFLCLRLTKNDGNSATVNELGLLGIRTVHNGSQPSAISYKNAADVERIIREEMKTIGTTDTELSDKMKEFNTPKKEWFTTSYYNFLNHTKTPTHSQERNYGSRRFYNRRNF